MAGRKTALPIANFILAWRKHRDLTQEQLGERAGEVLSRLYGEEHAGWHKGRISDMETKGIGITTNALRAFAVVLDCTVDDLLNRTPQEKERLLAERAAANELVRRLANMSPNKRDTARRLLDALDDPPN